MDKRLRIITCIISYYAFTPSLNKCKVLNNEVLWLSNKKICAKFNITFEITNNLLVISWCTNAMICRFSFFAIIDKHQLNLKKPNVHILHKSFSMSQDFKIVIIAARNLFTNNKIFINYANGC